MKKTFLILISLIISTLAFSQTTKNEAIIKEVNATELKRFEAQVKKDYATLDKILSPALVYTHSGGKVDNKESYVQSIKDGKSMYDAIESKEMNTHIINENVAVISGLCHIKLGGASPSEVDLRYTDVYLKSKKDGWQMITWQSLKLTPAAK